MRRKRNSKPLIFLVVLILHGLAVLLFVQASQQLHSPSREGAEPLAFLMLQKAEPSVVRAAPTPVPTHSKTPTSKPQQAPEASNAIATPQPAATPQIDWQHEAELAALNEISQADKEQTYRNLAGLSAAQLKFVRDNQLVPMAPGVVWAKPVVEVDKATLIPIIHINDHCVLILLFPFCRIGHITPNSHLLDHMRDPPAQ